MSGTYRGGNRIKLLTTGSEYFPALVAAIDAAQNEVRLETYIFEDDATGRRVADALMRAARRGVHVRVAVDGFGSPFFMERFGDSLTASGVDIDVYRPELARFRIRRHRLRRLHRKLACIDAHIAFAGGINIIDDLNPPDLLEPRLDYAVSVEGPLVADIHRTMSKLWFILRWVKLGHRPQARRSSPPLPNSNGTLEAALVIRDNVRHRREIERAYLSAIFAAREEIIIANAYFLPGRNFRHVLRTAAKRGIKVTLLLEGRVEYRLQYYATLALYNSLLSAGVRVFEYRKSYLHAKVAVVDDAWATVGSSNIDPFSLMLAREANVLVRDQAFARQLRSSLEYAMAQGAVEITGHAQLSYARRLLGWLAYGLLRFAAGVAGYGKAL